MSTRHEKWILDSVVRSTHWVVFYIIYKQERESEREIRNIGRGSVWHGRRCRRLSLHRLILSVVVFDEFQRFFACHRPNLTDFIAIGDAVEFIAVLQQIRTEGRDDELRLLTQLVDHF